MDTRKKKIKPWLRSPKERIHVPVSDSDSDSGPTSKTLREYGSATSVHGIPYILEDGRKPVERLLWIIFVGIGAGTATYFSFNIYQDWQNQQVITSVGTTGYNVENILFYSAHLRSSSSQLQIWRFPLLTPSFPFILYPLSSIPFIDALFPLYPLPPS